MLPGKSITIDLASPVNWQWQGNLGLDTWYLCLPGFMGGAKWRDLCGPIDLTIGNHGTLTNMVQGNTSGWIGSNRPGGFGALRFDGTNDVVTLPNGGPITAGPFSLFHWTRKTTTGLAIPYGQGNSASGQFIGTRVSTVFGVSVDGTNVDTGATTLTAGTWYHLGITYSATSLKIYVNGALDGTATETANFTSTLGKIGAGVASGGGASNFYGGLLDDVRFYNRALGVSEVLNLYLESSNGYPRGLRRRRPWFIGTPGASYSSSTAEAATIADAESAALDGVSAQTETATAADATDATTAAVSSVAEAASVADTSSAVVAGVASTVAESLTVAETSSTAGSSFGASVAEAMTSGDTADATGGSGPVVPSSGRYGDYRSDGILLTWHRPRAKPTDDLAAVLRGLRGDPPKSKPRMPPFRESLTKAFAEAKRDWIKQNNKVALALLGIEEES